MGHKTQCNKYQRYPWHGNYRAVVTVILEAITEVRQEHLKQLSAHECNDQHGRSAPFLVRNQHWILLRENHHDSAKYLLAQHPPLQNIEAQGC